MYIVQFVRQHWNMFLKNKQQANYYKNEHQNINGKCKNKSPPERHRPPESCNAVYNQSKIGLYKNNKKCQSKLEFAIEEPSFVKTVVKSLW